MVDEQARREVRAAVDDFIAGRITAFALDDRLQAIDTRDSTVQRVVRIIWCTYDDLHDHGIDRWNKQTWDLVQRLLLVLDSGADLVDEHHGRIWDVGQLVAIGALGAMTVLALGYLQFLPALLSGGLISVGITAWRNRRDHQEWPANPAEPFTSVRQIRQVLERMPTWRKRRHPGFARTLVRVRWLFVSGDVVRYLLWILVSPVTLLIQALPRSRTTMGVVLAGRACVAEVR